MAFTSTSTSSCEQGRAETAHAAVALDADDAALLGECQELIGEGFVAFRHHEAYIHDGTVFLDSGAAEQAVAVVLYVAQVFWAILCQFQSKWLRNKICR